MTKDLEVGSSAAGLKSSQLVSQALCWDNHTCLPIRPLDGSFLPQLERHWLAGWNVVSVNVGFGSDSVETHLRMIAALRAFLAQNVDKYLLVESATDIALAKESSRLGVFFDIEGMGAVADQPELVDLYYSLGVRWMLVAFNRNNAAGGGCHDDDSGLTEFGRRVIRRMNDCGMLLCCSHTGERTAFQAIEASSSPVILSHSNSNEVYSHPRNVSDQLMRACAATGGVVGLNGLGIFLGDNEATVERFMLHLRHAVDTVGFEHVGIGLDYVYDQEELDDWLGSPSNTWPPGFGYKPGVKMLPPESLRRIVEAMLAVGWSDQDIRQILGENLNRLAQRVWR